MLSRIKIGLSDIRKALLELDDQRLSIDDLRAISRQLPTSYLAAAWNRSNLDIVVNTRVTKVLPLGHESGKPIMRGVEITQSADGQP